MLGQSYSGPEQGSVPNGAINNTSFFEKYVPITQPKERVIKHKDNVDLEQIFVDFGNNVQIPKTVYVEDNGISKKRMDDTISSIMLNSFQGIAEQNGIPPDPYIAVGKNHVVGTVNSRFNIWDKQGNLLNSIDAEIWYNSVLPNNGAFDPKITYDHFADRWVLTYLHQNDANQTAHLLISVSDDENPVGTWYSWALPTTLNGTSPSGNWGDYQGVGLDHEAIYVTTNQFGFGSSFNYTKIRIIPKAQLYANTAGACIWFDIWNIGYPGGIGGNPFTLRPTLPTSVTTPYVIMQAPSGGGNFVSIYKISNPTTNPTLTGSVVSVPYFYTPPQANQLGGSTTLIDGGTNCSFRFEPIYKDGYIYAVQGVRNPNNSSYSAFRYYKIDVAGNAISENITFGSLGYWYLYPTIAVDGQNNVAISYSRSGDTEYAGAFYMVKKANDLSNQFISLPLMEGKANYVKTYTGTRNRWGDYNGIWLDPVNKKDFWMLTEYVHAVNTWGTWVGQFRAALEAGAYLISTTPETSFEPVEVGEVSDDKEVMIKNFGDQNLVISNIDFQTDNFSLVNNPTFPLTLIPYETKTLKVKFNPIAAGNFSDTIQITSNSASDTKVVLIGRGYTIAPANSGKIYASSGLGKTYLIDFFNSQSLFLGNSNYPEIRSIAVDPIDKVIYGLVPATSGPLIIHMNADSGDAYKVTELAIPSANSIAFDTTGILYLVTKTGTLYKVNRETAQLDSLCDIKCDVNSIAIDPLTNEMWGSIYKALGSPKDRIFKINISTGDTTNVGSTGFATMTNSLAFDASGNLYGIKGASTQISDFFRIDKQTGVGTIIGSLGVNNITSLAFAPGLTSAKEISNNVPDKFALEQNYPNPFNPETVIRFALPTESHVSLSIYNLLGEKVAELLNEFRNSGTYEVKWNGLNSAGKQMSSGIYFYELRGIDETGIEKSEIKKMVMMR